MDLKIRNDRLDDWHLTDRLNAEHGKGDPFAAAIRATRMSMIITDPRQHDNPIVFANRAFQRLSGYPLDEIAGRNCRFLQGPETDDSSVMRIREAVNARRDINLDILNYRKDGTTFWNALYISPVINEAGELLFFFASQLDVTDRKTVEAQTSAELERIEVAVRERTSQLEDALQAQETLLHEVDHRVKNNLQMVSSLIVLQRRTISDPKVRDSLGTMLERIEALSTVHRRLYQSKDVSSFDVADFIRDLVTDLHTASSRPIALSFDLEPVSIPAEKATPVALIANELVTNVLKHAFGPLDGQARGGSLKISLHRRGEGFAFSVADNGAGMADEVRKDGFGTRLVNSLVRQLGATIVWTPADPGTRVTVTVPPQQEDS
jgi:PAS domain S-box-containing protein